MPTCVTPSACSVSNSRHVTGPPPERRATQDDSGSDGTLVHSASVQSSLLALCVCLLANSSWKQSACRCVWTVSQRAEPMAPHQKPTRLNYFHLRGPAGGCRCRPALNVSRCSSAPTVLTKVLTAAARLSAHGPNVLTCCETSPLFSPVHFLFLSLNVMSSLPARSETSLS